MPSASMKPGSALESDLLDRIYRTPFEPTLWRSILDDMSVVADARGALVVIAPDHHFGHIAVGSVERNLPNFLQRAPYLADSRRLRVYNAEPRFMDDTDVFSPHELETLPYCEDFLVNIERGRQLAAFQMTPDADSVNIHFRRGPDDGPFADGVAQWLEGFRPHILRALEITARAERARMRGIVSTLSHLGIPAGFMTFAGTLIVANDAFESCRDALFGRPANGTGFGRGPAAASLREGLETFRQAWANCYTTRPSLSVPVKGGREGERYILHLMRNVEGPETLSVGVLVMLTPVGEARTLPVEMIAYLFGLTMAEAAIARDVGEGRSVAEIAAARRLSEHTVRFHIKTIFEKVDVHRQVDLVRLLQHPVGPVDDGTAASLLPAVAAGGRTTRAARASG